MALANMAHQEVDYLRDCIFSSMASKDLVRYILQYFGRPVVTRALTLRSTWLINSHLEARSFHCS